MSKPFSLYFSESGSIDVEALGYFDGVFENLKQWALYPLNTDCQQIHSINTSEVSI